MRRLSPNSHAEHDVYGVSRGRHWPYLVIVLVRVCTAPRHRRDRWATTHAVRRRARDNHMDGVLVVATHDSRNVSVLDKGRPRARRRKKGLLVGPVQLFAPRSACILRIASLASTCLRRCRINCIARIAFDCKRRRQRATAKRAGKHPGPAAGNSRPDAATGKRRQVAKVATGVARGTLATPRGRQVAARSSLQRRLRFPWPRRAHVVATSAQRPATTAQIAAFALAAPGLPMPRVPQGRQA